MDGIKTNNMNLIYDLKFMSKKKNIDYVNLLDCYDINDVSELEDFFEDFKYSQIKSYLFAFIKGKGNIYK